MPPWGRTGTGGPQCEAPCMPARRAICPSAKGSAFHQAARVRYTGVQGSCSSTPREIVAPGGNIPRHPTPLAPPSCPTCRCPPASEQQLPQVEGRQRQSLQQASRRERRSCEWQEQWTSAPDGLLLKKRLSDKNQRMRNLKGGTTNQH